MEPSNEPDVTEAPEALYEILLGSGPPESLRSRFPRMSVQATGAQTALRRRVSGPAQLDALLEKVFSLGLRLVDVHLLPGTAGEDRTYEVRVDGEVGEPLLRYLSWSHRIVPGQIRVQVPAATGELQVFLRACTDRGTSIERVSRAGASRRHEAAYD